MMRQFVFGLIVAGVALWGYKHWFQPDPVETSYPEAAAVGAPVTGVLPASVMATGAADGAAPAASPAAHAQGSAGAPAEASLVASETVDAMLEGIASGDVGAISRGWLALAGARLGSARERVARALEPKGERFEQQLRWLGTHNAFLHSPEGRAAAEQVLRSAMALPDADAVKAGSQLVYLMTRGRIELTDNAVRAAVDRAYREHRIRVDRWTCNPSNVAGARSYTVKAGDSLDAIAASFRKQKLMVESGTLQLLNRISNPQSLQRGQQLKIPVAPVSAVLEKRSFALMVFVGDELVRLYWVGHGANDRTPVTEFEVIAKLPQPQWTAPDGNVYPYGHPKNILGEYFIKFGHTQYSGFGAHGTPMPETIGTQSSMGCIRMFAPDIEELFQVLPRHAKVIVAATESL